MARRTQYARPDVDDDRALGAFLALDSRDRSIARDKVADEREARMAESQRLRDEMATYEFEKQKTLDLNAGRMKIETDKEIIAANEELFKINTAEDDADVKLDEWAAKHFRVLGEEGDKRLTKQFEINRARAARRREFLDKAAESKAEAEAKRTAGAEFVKGALGEKAVPVGASVNSQGESTISFETKQDIDRKAAEKDEATKQRRIGEYQQVIDNARKDIATTMERYDTPPPDALALHNDRISSAVKALAALDPENPLVKDETSAVEQRRRDALVTKHDALEAKLETFKYAADVEDTGGQVKDEQGFRKTARDLNKIKADLGYETIDVKTGKVVPAEESSAEPAASPSAPAIPEIGTVKQGYRFKGGDPADRNSWEKT